MKILVVTHVFPWPADRGSRIRVAEIVRALAMIGDVELFSILSTKESREINPVAEPAGHSVVRSGTAVRPSTSYTARRRLRWIIGSSLPFEVGSRDYSLVRSAFLAWAQPPYDLVWMAHAETAAALGDLVHGPCIVDLDDLEDHKAIGRMRTKRLERLSPRSLFAWCGSALQGKLSIGRWRRLQERIASRVDSVVVCSELDRSRLGVANCLVVPNSYPPPARPLGRIEVGDPPTLTLVGALSYGPNADAARYLVEEILPRVRARIPGAQARLVGEHDHRIEDLATEDVILTGALPDLSYELARADVVIVPLRFAGGTRIKVLEAFAHLIPVVATSIACEGLDVAHEKHLLIADDADDLADASVLLMTNASLRRRLTEAAGDLYQQRYRSDAVDRRIEAVAGLVMARREANALPDAPVP